MDIADLAEKVSSREDFVRFLHALSMDCRQNGGKWEHSNIASYLDAASRWTENMDSAFKNAGEAVPEGASWKLFAQILMAACQYE